MVEASLPGRPRSVNATQKTAQSIVLAAEPPVEDNCIDVIAFEIVYRIHGTGLLPRSLVFTLGKIRMLQEGNLVYQVQYLMLFAQRKKELAT